MKVETLRPGGYVLPNIMKFCEYRTAPGRGPAVPWSARVGLAPRLRLPTAFGLVALCSLLVSCGPKTEQPPAPPASQTNAAPSAAAVSPELAKLAGKWERPDGGYVLEIKGIDASGKADVAYYNPSPINVSRAAAWRDKGTNKIVIELNDTGYPGCTYTLEHNAQTDQLVGQYFQAAQQATYEVVFSRLE